MLRRIWMATRSKETIAAFALPLIGCAAAAGVIVYKTWRSGQPEPTRRPLWDMDAFYRSEGMGGSEWNF